MATNFKNAYLKVRNWWIDAQLAGKQEFIVHMKNGTDYQIKHFKSSPMNPTWGSFSVFKGKELICNEISNTDDLAEILIKLGK